MPRQDNGRKLTPARADASRIGLPAAVLLLVLLFPVNRLLWAVSGGSLLLLALLGALAARAGGASVPVAAARVTFWGALAMAVTAGIGALFGVSP